jgi:Winged helix-turn helix
VNFIKEHFAKNYTPSSAISLLHRLNFAYKKPQLVPGKANAENQERFLKDLKMLEDQLSETDQLVYIDGLHPQQCATMQVTTGQNWSLNISKTPG